MASGTEERRNGIFSGVSLSSFLQMLEQERKSCTLIVNCDGREGRFYFDDGKLVDAQSANAVGREAVYAILSWDHPSLQVEQAEDRMRRITEPLAHILLDYAKRRDEEELAGATSATAKNPLPHGEACEHADPAVRRVARKIMTIRGIRHYYFLNRQGNVITQSSSTLQLGDFITYCIVSGIQMRNVLNVRGPNRIQLVFQDGETLLILPGAGMIIGLLLEAYSSVSDIVEQLRPVLVPQ